MTTQEFKFENELELRVVSQLENEQTWFVAMDVCSILELTDVSMSLQKLDDDEKLIQKLFVSGQNRDVWIVNESGLYNLIFSSYKPEAKKFRKWVTSEVLPSIRVSGKYSNNEILNRDKLIQDKLEENKRLEQENRSIIAKKKENENKIKDNDDMIRKLLTTDFRQYGIDFSSTAQV